MTGAFPKNVVPGNEFSFHIFTTFYVVALVQLESRRCLQIAFLLYHRDINTKRFADVGHRTDSDLRLFTYSLMNYCFSWLGIKSFSVDAFSKSRNYRIMEIDLGSTNAVDKASPTLGWVVTLCVSARVPRFIRTRTQFVGRLQICALY